MSARLVDDVAELKKRLRAFATEEFEVLRRNHGLEPRLVVLRPDVELSGGAFGRMTTVKPVVSVQIEFDL